MFWSSQIGNGTRFKAATGYVLETLFIGHKQHYTDKKELSNANFHVGCRNCWSVIEISEIFEG